MRHREGENRCKLTGGILNQKGTGEATIESSVSSRTTIEQPRREIVPGLGSTEMTTTRRDDVRETTFSLRRPAGRQAHSYTHYCLSFVPECACRPSQPLSLFLSRRRLLLGRTPLGRVPLQVSSLLSSVVLLVGWLVVVSSIRSVLVGIVELYPQQQQQQQEQQ